MSIPAAKLAELKSKPPKKVDLSNQRPKLTDADIEDLVKDWAWGQVESLDVSCNAIGNRGAALLAKLGLKVLNISWNQVGLPGVQALVPSELEELNISANDFKDAGVVALAAMGPEKQGKLQTLKVAATGFSNVGTAEALAQSGIKAVDISSNRLNANGKDAIAKSPFFLTIDAKVTNPKTSFGEPCFTLEDRALFKATTDRNTENTNSTQPVQPPPRPTVRIHAPVAKAALFNNPQPLKPTPLQQPAPATATQVCRFHLAPKRRDAEENIAPVAPVSSFDR